MDDKETKKDKAKEESAERNTSDPDFDCPDTDIQSGVVDLRKNPTTKPGAYF